MSTVHTAQFTDEKIQQMVEDELRWHPEIDGTAIGVGVRDGAVTLTGEVGALLWRHAAAKAALRVRGVRSVANDIRVATPYSQVSDSEIAHTIQRILRWSADLPDGTIDAEVDNGVVILTGTVAWDGQRRSAEREVRRIRGVLGVDNRLTLSERPSASDTHQRITSALRRNAITDAEHIQVDVDGSRVTLRGEVGSYDEKRQAEITAWGSPHVTAVDNRLTIVPR